MEHVAGKDFFTPDALSRSPAPSTGLEDDRSEREVELFVNQVFEPRVKDILVRKLVQAQEEDEVIPRIKEQVLRGWSTKAVEKLTISAFSE